MNLSTRRQFLQASGFASLAAARPTPLHAAEPLTLVKTKELMQREPNTNPAGGKVWGLHRSATSRTNLVEMRGEGVRHLHPDAEHSLYVISGTVKATVGDEEFTLSAGDYISIPAGVPHSYLAPVDVPALLISMDAPPYDPQKTIRVKPAAK